MPRPPDVAGSVAGIPGSVYSALADRLARFEGTVYPLHVGDTWMEPPEGCRMEDFRVADHPGMHRYASPQGLPQLIEAIAGRLSERTGLATEPSSVLVAAGATGALGAVAGAIVDPGDEVLILAPYWPLISGIVRSFHGTPVPVPVLGRAGSAEEVTTALDDLLTERTVALYLNTPNNPTGRVLPRPWVEALAEWARRHDLWLLSDEVYEETLYEGEHVYARPLAPERTFSAHSFSKAYGMAGNRCGWVVGPAEVMGELRKVSTHTFYSTPTASQLAAVAALEDGRGERWAAHARELYRAIGGEAAERLGVEAPAGSTFLFLDVADRLDERGLGGFLEDCADRGLFLAPGPSFGPYPTSVRVCFTAAPPEVVREGVGVLAGLLGR
ncbi:MAG: pyridoxal phosphate-dependent aminotransferase [Thermoanaerobaculia bacterium]